jgi:cadmium resistance protein CadD (predicted permease)
MLLLIVPIAVGAFVATNLDNLALLAVFLVRYRHRTVIVGAYILADTATDLV